MLNFKEVTRLFVFKCNGRKSSYKIWLSGIEVKTDGEFLAIQYKINGNNRRLYMILSVEPLCEFTKIVFPIREWLKGHRLDFL
jgi:hypothetical protein